MQERQDTIRPKRARRVPLFKYTNPLFVQTQVLDGVIYFLTTDLVTSKT